MRAAEQMAAVGELSAAVAHDFRNPIAAIAGSAQLLKNVHIEDSNTDPANRANRHLTEIILRETGRMEKTITDFLHFARPADINPEWFDLKKLAEETVLEIKNRESCPLGATIETDIPDHLDCWADQQLVQTVLAHLLENSCAAAAKTGAWPVLVRAQEEQTDDQNCICIAVIDQGAGIAKNIREMIFTPFFSTKANCAGLGLAVVKQTVDQHDGTINILDTEQGCTIEVRLPLPSLSGEE
jgi:two-component system sensor histidine kinase PilS (NtrC family)